MHGGSTGNGGARAPRHGARATIVAVVAMIIVLGVLAILNTIHRGTSSTSGYRPTPDKPTTPLTPDSSAAKASSNSSPVQAPTIIKKLALRFVPDPPIGPGYTTTGDYLQVSGVERLAAVNNVLRDLVLNDESIVRGYGTARSSAGPGIYNSDPEQGQISASSAVVSVMIPSNGIPPGGNDGGHWLWGTLLVPSAKEITLADLFISEPQGLLALANLTRKVVLATNSCVRQDIDSTAEGLGSYYVKSMLAGFNPTLSNYQTFAMTPAGLTIGLKLNQVSAAACGIPQATIRWDELKPYLNSMANQLITELR